MMRTHGSETKKSSLQNKTSPKYKQSVITGNKDASTPSNALSLIYAKRNGGNYDGWHGDNWVQP